MFYLQFFQIIRKIVYKIPIVLYKIKFVQACIKQSVRLYV